MISFEDFRKNIKGEVLNSAEVLKEYSRDASIFEVKPEAVIFPKDSEDIKTLVKFVNENRSGDPSLSITPRSGGTDMSGGPLNNSTIVSFTKYFNHIGPLENNTISVEPGVYYRDFEKETLKRGLILPSFPASREICAIGGMVANNAGGEKGIRYGKTDKYVKKIKVVLSDGNEYTTEPLDDQKTQEKLKLNNFEGEVYRKIYGLVTQNHQILKAAKPRVLKNSSGYALWDIWDEEKRVFDLTKLLVGSQGTLGIVTEATFALVPTKRYSKMLVVFLKNLEPLSEIIETVLPYQPESFESYDDHTLKLAIKFFPSFAKLLGTKSLLSLFWQFLPEIRLIISGGLPKLVLQIEFAGDNQTETEENIKKLKKSLEVFGVKMRMASSEEEVKKI